MQGQKDRNIPAHSSPACRETGPGVQDFLQSGYWPFSGTFRRGKVLRWS
jgi:hypothetical protein